MSSKASEEQVDEISEQEAPAFDRAAFKAALMARIAQTAPSSLEQADNFKGNNNLSAMKSELSGKVKEGKEQSQGPIEEKAKEAPDTSGVEPKPVTPLAEQKPGPAPAKLGAAAAAPKPRTAAEVENPIRESSQSIDQEMTEGGVTEEQLAQSNEPEFESALGSKREAQEHAAQAPGAFRGQEQEQLQGAQAQAEEAAGAKTSAMHGQRATILQQVAGSQTSTKTQDEQKRAEVASRIESIYEKTRSEVEARLATLDQEAAQAFEGGAADAKQRFESYVERRMNAYKARRYDGITGAALWLTDKVFGMPSAVNAFYTQGRDLYIAQMDRVIDRVVDVVATGLSDAKQRVAQGRQEIKSYVASLPQALREVGQNAAGDIQAKFDALNQTVSDKQEELVTELANRYNESVQAVDAQIESMKAENQGLVDKAIGAVRAVIQKIVQLKDMLFGVLKKAASVVDRIVTAPIEFLGNLVSGVKRGLDSFVSNIGKHLKSGLIGWLTGAISSAGIVVPENLDLKGIFSLVTQVLGLTWTNIRQKLVKRLGEKVVAGLEKTYDVLKMLITKGPIALWELVKDKIGDLKAMVMDKIEDFLITKVIKAGITWIIGLLNPAAALIKAVKAIYDIIMFFVNRGSQIMSLVNAILDSVISIAKGNLSGAAKLVENALAKAVPVAIGFLASLLGLGGISEKVRDIMKAVRRPIDKAIGFVIDKVVKAGKKLARTGVFGKAKSAYGKAKAGVKKVKEKAKEVYSDARAKAKAAAGKATDRLGGKKKPPEGKERSALMSDVRKAVSAVTNQPFKKDADAKAALGGVLKVFQPKGLQALDAKPKPKAAGAFDVIARNPTKSDVGDVRTEEDDAKAVAAKEAVSRALGSDFPALVKILHALIDDREHPLSLVRDLKDSTMRPRVIALIREMAERRALGDKPFEEFMRDHPGAGPLYEKVKPGLNYDESGASKKEAFVEEAKESDPARAAGAELSDKEEKLVREYQRKLISKVEAKVRSEVEALARSIETKLGGRATVSIRTKTAEGLIDKVRRMVSGAKGRRVRLDYQVGDVIDAVGARITVDNTEALEKLLAETKERYADDILEVENMYATPKAHARAYRVIPFVIKTEIDGEWFTFELQLNTLRASIAADLEHNTVFKPLIEVTEDQKQMVKAMMAEAAVLDQLETREAST